MIKNAYRYVKTVVDGKRILLDLKNCFRVVSSRQSKGSPKKGIEPGTTITLQITEDISEPIYDKETGEVKDNNVFETFDVTIVGKTDLGLKKGDLVALEGFLPEISYYINFNLILRFSDVRVLNAKGQPQGSINHAISGQTK